jgi:hypothetical protein
MARQQYVQEIVDALALLSRKVEINNSLNLTDINVHSENFFRDFLNLALGLKLKNINEINPNADAIDLADTDKRWAIQVTSTSAIKKTKDTVRKFCEKGLHAHYDRLIILNLVSVTRHKDILVGDDPAFKLNTRDDMWDYNDIARMLSHGDTEFLKNVADFINRELGINKAAKLSKEVLTLIAMIDLLSDDDHPAAGNGFIEAPDPERKVYNRFAAHANYLTETYVDLYIMYGKILDTIIEEKDIGTVRLQKMGLYLKSVSDLKLTQHGGNPKSAINGLVREFSALLGERNVEFDEKAIEFYLIDQLIRCNVFPQLERSNV